MDSCALKELLDFHHTKSSMLPQGSKVRIALVECHRDKVENLVVIIKVLELVDQIRIQLFKT